MIPLREGRTILPETLRDMANPPWEASGPRILIVRLSAWSDVDISNPHLVLFAETRATLPDAYIDFAFLPPAPDRASLDSRGIPWFFGRASGRSPSEFDLVMVSNAFALELVNLPRLFSTARLPVLASRRQTLERSPIVIVGGSNASCAGSLAVRAGGPSQPATESIPDGIFFGEGEGAIGELAAILSGARDPGGTGPAAREARLVSAGEIEGFWPCLQQPGARRRRPGPATVPLLAYPVLNGASASTARLSITSGCPGFCSFCLEGWDRRPYRELPLASAIESARILKKATGADTLDVYSFNFNTHADVDTLILELNRIFDRVSFMSQRLDILARSPGLAALEMAGGKKSFTLGIEGVSARMRAYYRKGLAPSDLDACLAALTVPGVKEIKLFYIISGLETESDSAEFSAFMESLSRLRAEKSPGLRIIASAGFLVRLPFTPLQFAPLVLEEKILKGISAALRLACESRDIEYREASEYGEFLVDQRLALDSGTLLPWLASLTETPWVYDANLPGDVWRSMRRHLEGAGAREVDLAGEKSPEWRPPLEFAEPEERHRVLRRHYEKARAAIDRPGCLGASCSECGACDDPGERVAMLRHPPARAVPLGLAEKTRRLLAAKAVFARIAVDLELPEDIAEASDEYRKSWVLRRIFRSAPGSERVVFSASELLFPKGERFGNLFPRGVGRFGRARFVLEGPDEARLRDAAARAGFIPDPQGTEGLLRQGEQHPAWMELGFGQEWKAALSVELGPWLEEAGIPHLRKSLPGGEAEFVASESALGRRVFAGASLGRPPILVLGDRAPLGRLLAAMTAASGSPSPLIRVLGWRASP